MLINTALFGKKFTLKYKEKLEENILELIDEFDKYFNKEKELDNIFDILSYLKKLKIPFLEKIKSQNIEIKNVVADAGYESFPNYEYLEKIIMYLI